MHALNTVSVLFSKVLRDKRSCLDAWSFPAIRVNEKKITFLLSTCNIKFCRLSTSLHQTWFEIRLLTLFTQNLYMYLYKYAGQGGTLCLPAFQSTSNPRNIFSRGLETLGIPYTSRTWGTLDSHILRHSLPVLSPQCWSPWQARNH